MLSQDWTSVVPDLTLDGEQLITVGRLNYLDSGLTKNDSMMLEVITCASKTQPAYAGLKQPWR